MPINEGSWPPNISKTPLRQKYLKFLAQSRSPVQLQAPLNYPATPFYKDTPVKRAYSTEKNGIQPYPCK